MPVFHLSDRLRDLILEEKALLGELRLKKAEYLLVKSNLPVGVSPLKTPAFFSLLVAHRKWQFAYEKKKRLSRSPA